MTLTLLPWILDDSKCTALLYKENTNFTTRILLDLNRYTYTQKELRHSPTKLGDLNARLSDE
jgi:hypothetical protein